MPSDFEIRGAEEFARLAKALKEAGNGELRKELLRRMRAAGEPITKGIKSDLGSKMPQRGGLARALAKAKVSVRNRVSGKQAGIRIEAKHIDHDLEAIDKGIVRHPVYGHGPWVAQRVPEGTVTERVEHGKGDMQHAVTEALEDIARKIDRSV